MAEYYRNMVFKHWRLIIICSLLTAIGTGLGSYFISPTYQSTAILQLMFFSSDASSLAAANQQVAVESRLATSDSILRQVAAQYPGLTLEQLQKEVSTQVGSTSQLLEISVTDHDAVRAARLANAIAAVLIAQQKQATQQQNAQSQQPLIDALAATQKQINADQATLDSLQTNPTANKQQIQQLQSDLSNLQKQYDQELQTLTTLQNDEARSTTFLQLVDAAQPSSKPLHTTSWHAAIAVAGLALGFLLGILLVLFRDRLDQQIPTVSALSKLLGWTVLEELDMPASSKASAGNDAGHEGTPQEAPYHLLAQNLAFLGIETPLSLLAVTSTPADSKAANVVAGGLAAALVKSGKRTVLVDANFFRPSQHRRFGTAAEPGLGAAVLAFSASRPSEQSLESYLYPTRDESSLLRIMPAGPIPPNPKQVLKSQAVGEVLQALTRTEADAVVLAAPPVTNSEESCVLPALADGAIVVIGRSHARKVQLLRLKRTLSEAKVKVLGCVVWSGAPNQPQNAEQPDTVVGAGATLS